MYILPPGASRSCQARCFLSGVRSVTLFLSLRLSFIQREIFSNTNSSTFVCPAQVYVALSESVPISLSLSVRIFSLPQIDAVCPSVTPNSTICGPPTNLAAPIKVDFIPYLHTYREKWERGVYSLLSLSLSRSLTQYVLLALSQCMWLLLLWQYNESNE